MCKCNFQQDRIRFIANDRIRFIANVSILSRYSMGYLITKSSFLFDKARGKI